MGTMLLMAFAAGAAQAACTITWTGGAGNSSWNETGNWSPKKLPKSKDNVCIPTGATVEAAQEEGSVLSVQSQGTLVLGSNGAVRLSEASSTTNLTQAGTLGGVGTLTISGTLSWSGGTQAEKATTVLASGASASISGEDILGTGRTLQVNAGATATIEPAGSLLLEEAAHIENAGSFSVNGDETGIFPDGGSGQRFHNTGTFTDSGAGNFRVGVPFDNDATVAASAGMLSFEAGDSGTTSGSFSGTGANGLVRFSSGTFTLEAKASLNGRTELNNATLNAAAAVPVGGTFTQSGGTLGGLGTVTISGTLDWTGGTQSEKGTTVIASGATASIPDEVFLGTGRTLQVNAGATATIEPEGFLFLGEAARVENLGTFNASGGESGIFNNGGTGQLFHNAGTFTRSGTGNFRVDVPFDNDGSVTANSGSLSFEGGDSGTTTGSFSGSGANGLISFAAGAFTLEAKANLSGRTELSNATLNATAAVPVSGTFTQSGGTLGGLGTLTISGTFDWTAGTQTEKGTTVLASGAGASITGEGILGVGRTLQVNVGATATIEPAGFLLLEEAAHIENAGSFSVNGNETGIFVNSGTGQLFHNAGTFTRSGSGNFRVGVPFDNDGSVTASAGTLSFEDGDSGTTSGTFNGAGASGLISFAAGAFTLEAKANLSGRTELSNATLNATAAVPVSGTFTQSGGRLEGTGTVTFSGSLTWNSGSEDEKGTTVIASGATLSIPGDVGLGVVRTLQVNAGATATMAPTGVVEVGEGARIENAGTFNVSGSESASPGIYAGTGTGQLLHNTGTFTDAGPGSFALELPVENDGTLEIAAGHIIGDNFTQSSSGALSLHLGGTKPITGFTQLTVSGPVALGGTLRVTTASGFHPKAGEGFQIITASPRSGTFATIEEAGTPLGGGLAYHPEYEETGVTLVVGAVKAEPTSTSTSLSGAGKAGASITVPEGTAVTDTATLTGVNIAKATGKVEYKVYSDNTCKTEVANAGKVTVTAGTVPASTAEVFAPGTYYWQATYNGDTADQPSQSACGSEIETVEEAPVAGGVPELGRCVLVGTGGGFTDSKCTLVSGAKTGKYEWHPGTGAGKTFTATLAKPTLETTTKVKVACVGGSATGEYTGVKAQSTAIALTGCELSAPKGQCTSEGAAAGEIRTSALEGQLGTIKAGAKPTVGVDLKPVAAAGGIFAKFSCGATAVVVKGSVIAPISTVDKMGTKFTEKIKASKGKQAPEKFEVGASDVLGWSLGGKAEERVGLSSTTTIKTGEALEIKAL